jgi:hypothetical protein
MNQILANSVHVFELEYSKKNLENGLTSYSNPEEGNRHILKYLALGPTFAIVSSALEESTYINHITGAPFVRTSIFYNQIFSKAIISIEFEDGNTIDVKSADLGAINYNLVKMIVKSWTKDVL